jgi:hypothetical protein
MKALITTVFLCAATIVSTVGVASAQTPASASKPATHKAAAIATRTECTKSIGLCVAVPPSWQRLGDIFDDLGFVVAEPHAGIDSATWPQLTVAAIDVPAQKNGAAQSLDSLVDIVLTPDGSFTSAETLQRTRLLLNGSEAEILRVQLHDTAHQADSNEAIALISGDDGLVYSIALRCAPQDFPRLEPVFQKAAHSWHIKKDAAVAAPKSTPKQDSEKK